jgi:bifunctional DNase/RNase
MGRVKLLISGLSTGQSSGSYTLILSEENGKRKLPIVIGSFEAQAIAIEIEKIAPFRPMTHDLFVNFCKAFDIIVHEVVIFNLHEGVFHAKLICEQLGEIREIDARTSDAIAIAVRFKCPIFTFSEIMDIAGIDFNEDEDDQDEESEEEEFDEDNELENILLNIDQDIEFTVGMTSGATHDQKFKKYSLEQLHELLEKAIEQEEYSFAVQIRDEINKRTK